jgi:hypothetical protein
MKKVTANGADVPALGFGAHGMSRKDMLRTVPVALSAESAQSAVKITEQKP